MATVQPPDVTRSRRIYVYWGVALSLLLALGLVCWLVVPLVCTGIILQKVAVAGLDPREAVAELGGPVAALPALKRYAGLPSMVPNRHVAVGIMGHCGRPAVPFLIETFAKGEDTHKWFAIRACADIGKAAVPELLTALGGANSDVRYCSATALGNMGRKARDAVPALTENLKSTNASTRSSAAEALGEIGPYTDDAVAGLTGLMADPDVHVRASTAFALGRCPAKYWNAVVPFLVKALNDRSEYVRRAAVRSVGRIGNGAKAAVPALTALLDDVWTREYAVRSLGRIGPAASSAVPKLRSLLKSPNADVRAAAAEALGRIRPESSEVLPALLEALRDVNGWVRRAAVVSLGKMGPEGVPGLLEAMRSKRATVRAAAAKALGRIGDAQAIKHLKEAMKDKNQSVRQAAAEALKKLRGGAGGE